VKKHIKTEISGNERAQYGKEIVSTLTRQLNLNAVRAEFSLSFMVLKKYERRFIIWGSNERK